MRVSLARAYTAAGITQMVVSRQPRPAAIAFIARDRPTQATFSVRGRSARRPCSANAMPRAAKISAPASGMPASSAEITGTCSTWRTMTYWASQLTTAAAAARTARAAIALRSQARPVSGTVTVGGGAPFRVGRASSAGGVAGQGLVVLAACVTVIRASSG